MLFRVILVSKNRSIYARTLHTVLGIQAAARQSGVALDLVFVNDDEVEKLNILKKNLKGCDRIIWIDYGMSVTRETIQAFFVKAVTGTDGAVLPAPLKDKVDWGAFKAEVEKNTTEPVYQVALKFDTEVGTKEIIPGIMHEVRSTTPQLWYLDAKKASRKINKNAEGARVLEDVFKKAKLQLGAITFSDVHTHFTHECMGNIMNMSGLTVS